MTRYRNLLGAVLALLACGTDRRMLRSVICDRPQNATVCTTWRPQVHFSPRSGFMNDPNGLVFYSGEYHLFYQLNPYGDRWGHMSWGHAVSPDLLAWRDLLIALRESGGVMMFSGSAVVDRGNTSGLCKEANCLVAVYTGHTDRSETQNLAVSNDDGRSFTPYERNPVLDLGRREFRDPKVFWHAPSRQWVMVAALPPEHKVRLFGSPDLKHWSELSDFGPAGATAGVWECPDLFELPLEEGGSRWVLKVDSARSGAAGGGAGQYFVGRFDGAAFHAEPSREPLWIDYGKDFYAAQSFNDAPYGRRIWIGWMDNWQYANQDPTQGWRGMQSLPRDLRLVRTSEGFRLAQRPVAELRSLRERRFRDLRSFRGDCYELAAEIDPAGAEEFGFRVRRGGGAVTVIGVRPRAGEVFLDRTRSGAAGFSSDFPGRHAAPLPKGGRVRLDIWVDRSSVEVFVNGGEAVISDRIYPPPEATGVESYSLGGHPKFISIDLWKLRPTRWDGRSFSAVRRDGRRKTIVRPTELLPWRQ